jgi:hypothetical protein
MHLPIDDAEHQALQVFPDARSPAAQQLVGLRERGTARG